MYYNFLKSLSLSYLNPHFSGANDSQNLPNIHPKMSTIFLSKTTHVLRWRHSHDSRCALVMGLEDYRWCTFQRGLELAPCTRSWCVMYCKLIH